MANASSPSIYEIMTIDKDGKTVDLKLATAKFSYYESLLSPNITAKMTFIDTGSAIKSDSNYDPQERISTVYNGLPITGLEKIKFKIKSKLGDLDFVTNPLYVNGAVPPGDEQGTRQVVSLDLVSKSAIKNQEATVFAKYRGNIGDTVKKILSDYLEISSDKVDVDEVKNSYNFIGNSRNPFEIICSLGPKTIPSQGLSGFFLYETQDGMNYKSIDKLISNQPKAVYYRNDGFKSSLDNDSNDYKISSIAIQKNQNVINALKSGVYVSRNLFFDPRDLKYTEVITELSKDGLKSSLGKDVVIPTEDSFTRTHYNIVDIGTLEKTAKGEINNDPREYQATSSTRYNLLFTQIVSMTVPCNPGLHAGDVIRCEFEMVTQGSKEQGFADPTQSGNYLILNLCHDFTPKKSLTSLTLVRDTYGLYTSK
jgi:hypothetical protein